MRGGLQPIGGALCFLQLDVGNVPLGSEVLSEPFGVHILGNILNEQSRRVECGITHGRGSGFAARVKESVSGTHPPAARPSTSKLRLNHDYISCPQNCVPPPPSPERAMPARRNADVQSVRYNVAPGTRSFVNRAKKACHTACTLFHVAPCMLLALCNAGSIRKQEALHVATARRSGLVHACGFETRCEIVGFHVTYPDTMYSKCCLQLPGPERDSRLVVMNPARGTSRRQKWQERREYDFADCSFSLESWHSASAQLRECARLRTSWRR